MSQPGDTKCGNPTCDAWTPIQTAWSFVLVGTTRYCTDACAEECDHA